jgi:restriction system protein
MLCFLCVVCPALSQAKPEHALLVSASIVILSVAIGAGTAFLYLVRKQQRQKREERRLERISLVDNILRLDPYEFEDYIGILLKESGYADVRQKGGSGDQGIDLTARRNGENIIVQCKRYDPGNKIGPKEIRDLRGTMYREGARVGIFVTTSDFTRGAVEDAKTKTPGQKIILVNGDRLAQWAQRFGLPGEVMPL